MSKPFLFVLSEDILQQRELTPTELELVKPILSDSKGGSTHFFSSVQPSLVGCIVAVRSDEVVKDGSIVLEHWNYHPSRKQLQLTHTTTHECSDQGLKLLPIRAKEAAHQTFNALSRLYA